MRRADLIEACEGLGFDEVGVCAADPIPHWNAYQYWLDRGFHGTMEYMERQAELRSDPASLLPGAKTIIAASLNYHQANPARPGKPRIAQYALGRDYHKVLRAKLQTLAKRLESLSPGHTFRACVDSAPIFEREYAQLAGLGWFGKNSMLINSRRGSYFFIGLLLTTLEIEADAPAIGGCGTCHACVEACPTGAIVNLSGIWQVDARRCISYLTIEHRGEIEPELVGKVGDWTVGCDVCQEVCPFNTERGSQPLRAQTSQEPDFLQDRKWPSLIDLAQISERDWDELTRGSAVRRVGFEGLRRNAANNIRNQSDVVEE